MAFTRKKQRFIDLSVPIQPPVEGEMKGDLAPLLAAVVDYVDHKGTAKLAAGMFGATPEDFPEGNGWAHEQVTLNTHAGTHIDAPYHYYPTCEGKPAKRIEELPLEELYGHGVRIDLRHKKSGEIVSAEEVQEALRKMAYTLQPGDIVYLWFDADKTFGTAAYWNEFPGMGAEATRWILDQGVKVIGTDAVGFDLPFHYIAQNFRQSGDRSRLWEAHRVGIDKEYFHIEKMANLDKLPPYGFTTMVFPVVVKGASAGWVRPVAIIEEE